MARGIPIKKEFVAQIGIQLVDQVKLFHDQGFVHNDIKPDNVLVNYKFRNCQPIKVDQLSKCEEAIIIDFGLSKEYIGQDGIHVQNFLLEKYKGYPAFLSKNALLRNTPSRRDDLIALVLSLIYMLSHNVSWYSRLPRPQIALIRLT